MDENELKRIWLIPDGNGWSWCDDPAPGWDTDERDSVEYIRADIYRTLRQKVEKVRDSARAGRNPNGDLYELTCLMIAEALTVALDETEEG